MPSGDQVSSQQIILIIVGNTFAVVTLLIKYWFSERANERKRKEDKEDRDQQMEIIRLEVERRHLENLNSANERHKRVVGLIRENTEISSEAFHQANTVNTKIEQLGLVARENEKELVETVKKVEEKLNGIVRKEIGTEGRLTELEAKGGGGEEK